MTDNAITRIPVRAERPYDVVVGHGLLGELRGLLGQDCRRVAIIAPAALATTAEAVREDLVSEGLEAIALEVPDGEAAKTPDVAAFCWSILGQAGFTRTDTIVAIGGGSTTDLAGFVAATWLRGVRVVHVPTTVLGMVDAAVGGKTGINIEAGKNLVGSFHEPAGVLCDLTALETLAPHDLVAGLAESVKCGLVCDPAILDLVLADPQDAVRPDSDRLREIIERSIRVKADVVASDLRESIGGPLGREVLNYGHTLGHAIERVEDYRWRHGAAISVGMVYVAELARLAGRLDDSTVDLHRQALGALGLPTTYSGGRWDRIHAAMRVDKKARGDMLRFVILDGVARPAILEGPDPALLAAAYAEVTT
ncbi:MAG: 3-dehydroquinate synthase [Actinobacteria bacterium]|nr:3-dehydroquinate synthase [Actinomycetota bacterium]